MGRNSQSQLRSAGLTNYSTEDYGTLATASRRKDVKAYCTSQKCCQYTVPLIINGEPVFYKKPDDDGKFHQRTELKFHTKVSVKVESSADYCPKCGGSLLWR
jgi:hypothetical protein